VYVADGHAPVPRPAKELKAFSKVRLAPGETKRVELALDRRAFAYFDNEKSWTVAPGSFEILVGSSSQQIELRGKVTLK
jgi:beta-glucosidase